MITSPVAELAFVDQIMAYLAYGPATTEDIARGVGTVICTCPLCDGAPRPARAGETAEFLARLRRSGAVTVVMIWTDFEWTLKWKRVR